MNYFRCLNSLAWFWLSVPVCYYCIAQPSPNETQRNAERPAPYPPSTMVRSVSWDPAESIERRARGGDNWPITWASDDQLYSTYGDGFGFQPFVEHKLSLGLVRISGTATDFHGQNLLSPTIEQRGAGRKGRKSWGLLCVDSTLYMWLGHADLNGGQSQLAWSNDLGKTWQFTDWKFAEFGLLGFVNFGKDYAGARDEYVYAYSHDGPLADTPSDQFVLLRCPKSELTMKSSWQFYSGSDDQGLPVWTSQLTDRRGVFVHPGACLRSGLTYNAGLKRYLWWQAIPQPPGHPDRGDTRFEGGFGIYEAPEPWGPWSTVYFTTKWDVGPGEHGDFPSKWMSEDGRRLYLVFSGEDCFSVRGLTFHLNQSLDHGATKSVPRPRIQSDGVPRGIDDHPDAPPPWQKLAYPASERFAGVEFDVDSRRREAFGSDIWPITWSDDGHQYAAFGDGGGFGGSNEDGRVSMGVSRVIGELPGYCGVNVWGGKDGERPARFSGENDLAKGKATGMISVEGILYLWVGRPKLMAKTGLASSRDHGRTWHLATWHWTMDDRISAGTFVNSGRDHDDAPDDFVYACFTRIETDEVSDRGWIYERPGRVDLARAPKNQLLDQSAWQWFGGRDDSGEPRWSAEVADRRPVFVDANGIKIVSMCYQPALKHYLLAYSPRDNSGNFALFEAQSPWGPWSEVAYLKKQPLFVPPKPNGRVSTFHFSPKWWSQDGMKFGLIFNVGDDAWNTVQGDLVQEGVLGAGRNVKNVD